MNRNVRFEALGRRGRCRSAAVAAGSFAGAIACLVAAALHILFVRPSYTDVPALFALGIMSVATLMFLSVTACSLPEAGVPGRGLPGSQES